MTFEDCKKSINEMKKIYESINSSNFVRNLEHSHDASQTFGHPKSHTLGQPAKGQS